MLSTTKRTTLKILIISILNFIASKELDINNGMNPSNGGAYSWMNP